MKKSTFLIIASTILTGSIASADSWNITQVAVTNNALFTTIHQKNATSNSLQAMNAITTEGTVMADQLAGVGTTGNLLLQQTDTVSASTQAINYAKPLNPSLNSYQTHQDVEGKGIILSQTTTGSNVIQGGNIVDTSYSNMGAASIQDIPTGADLTMNQQGTNLAVQAANGVITGNNGVSGAASSIAIQTANLSTLAISQGTASNSTQATNYLGSPQ